ncbi:MAG: polysaccharide deacetylase family protein [Phycisphaerales bacterium]
MSPSLAILCYHRLIEEGDTATAWPYLERGTAVQMASFRTQLRDIARLADVVSEGVALDVLAGHRTLARPAVWLTFDDGYRDALNAVAHDTTGTVFIPTCIAERSLPADQWYDVLLAADRVRGSLDLEHGSFAYDLRYREGRARLVDGPERRAYLRSTSAAQSATLQSLARQLGSDVKGSRGYLSRKELRQLMAAEWTIGSHGVTHTPFDAMEPADVAGEARASLEWLTALGARVRTIALPNGSAPEDPLGLYSCGYRCVLGLGNLPAEQGAAVQPRFIVPDDPHWVSRVLRPLFNSESV